MLLQEREGALTAREGVLTARAMDGGGADPTTQWLELGQLQKTSAVKTPVTRARLGGQAEGVAVGDEPAALREETQEDLSGRLSLRTLLEREADHRCEVAAAPALTTRTTSTTL